MDEFVKLGYEWRILREGNICYLSNILTQDLFYINSDLKGDILERILHGERTSEFRLKNSSYIRNFCYYKL